MSFPIFSEYLRKLDYLGKNEKFHNLSSNNINTLQNIESYNFM